ncbi:MAG: helix-turn-helix domain-containing protein [Bacteroidetes bacterium]|nr:helix-turn-helix domain-containing protein [Bacteroidota bacterium]
MRKITLKSLANQIGMSEIGFHQALKADRLKMNTIIKICEVLNTSTDYLLIDSIEEDIKHNGLSATDRILKDKSTDPRFNSSENVKKIKQIKIDREKSNDDYVSFLIRFPKAIDDPYIEKLVNKIFELENTNYLLNINAREQELENRELSLTIRELNAKIKELKTSTK